jgi:hypothetical protein
MPKADSSQRHKSMKLGSKPRSRVAEFQAVEKQRGAKMAEKTRIFENQALTPTGNVPGKGSFSRNSRVKFNHFNELLKMPILDRRTRNHLILEKNPVSPLLSMSVEIYSGISERWFPLLFQRHWMSSRENNNCD